MNEEQDIKVAEEPSYINIEKTNEDLILTIEQPPLVGKCTFKQMPDLTIQVTKWPNRWFRFWTKVFFSAKWERI